MAVSVVTGGAKGIGEALVLQLLQQGGQVVAADTDVAALEVLAGRAERDGAAERLATIEADVTRGGDHAAAADLAETAFGRLDAWYNNAAASGVHRPLVDITDDEFDATVALVLRSVFLGTREAARRLVAAGRGGAIVNTSSVAALVGGGGPMVYAACKAGVSQMTRYLAVELAPHRVRVNAVCPGSIVTPMAHRGDFEGTAARFRQRQPWPDYGHTEHVASVMAFLASDAAEFVTGESVAVDGGLVAAGVKVMPPPAATVSPAASGPTGP